MRGVPEFEEAGAMRHGEPPPDISLEHPVAHMEYIDDFGAVVLQPRRSSIAEGVQRRARKAPQDCGLDVHKEALGAVFELLGAEADLTRRLLLPKSEKFAVVVCATRGVVLAGFASPHEVDVLLGHWTHYALLQRMLYSVMDEVYQFVRRPPSGSVALPEGVRRELAMLVALAPLVRAISRWTGAQWFPWWMPGRSLAPWSTRSAGAPTSLRKGDWVSSLVWSTP